MDQKERRNYLKKSLIREQKRFHGMQIAQDETDARRQLRSLMNVRMAAPVTKEFAAVQDAYLQEVNAGRGIVSLSDLKKTEPGICLRLADENGLKSIAFCCISTGVFMFQNPVLPG